MGRYAIHEDGRCAVYQAFDDDGDHLYIGISSNPQSRLSAHRRKVWHRYVARVEVEWFPSRVAAKVRESELIRRHQPPANVNENPGLINPVLIRTVDEHQQAESFARARLRQQAELEKWYRYVRNRELAHASERECVECGLGSVVFDNLCASCRDYQYEAV